MTTATFNLRNEAARGVTLREAQHAYFRWWEDEQDGDTRVLAGVWAGYLFRCREEDPGWRREPPALGPPRSLMARHRDRIARYHKRS